MKSYFNILWFFLGFVACVRIIPDNVDIVYLNDKYISNASVYIKKYGKEGPYTLNILGINKHTWDNNVTVSLELYEYLHKQYKGTFMKRRFKLCDMLRLDPQIGAEIAKTGISCPVYSKMQRMLNITAPIGLFKYLFFVNKCMVQLEFSITSNHEKMGTVNFYFTVKK